MITPEEAVVGSMIIDPSCIPGVVSILRPECFSITKTREIFRSIADLEKRRVPVDYVTIAEDLKRRGKLDDVGGMYALSVITDRVISADHADEHAGIVYGDFVKREMGALGMKLYNMSKEPGGAQELLQAAYKGIGAIDYVTKTSVERIGDVIADLINEARGIIDGGGKRPGSGSGFRNIDRFHSSQKQDLGIIAARPGMGKTAFMLNVARNKAVEQGKAVLIFSLEMSTKKLVGRMSALESGVSSRDVNQKTMSAGQLMTLGAGVTRLLDAPIYFDETAGQDILELRAKIRRARREYGIEEVFIDYLQLMHGEKKGNREQEISFISRNLKLIAKEEDITITALCQLSREVEKRPDKRPQLSDLRESGAIEQDADWVWFLFRPEYYGIGDQTGTYDEETFDGRHLPTHGLLVVDSAKYREGALFKSALSFDGETMRVQDI